MTESSGYRYSVLQMRSIRHLSERQTWRWGFDVAMDWLVIIATMTIAVWAHHWAVYAAALVVLGNRQHALGILGHEGAHKTVHRRQSVNDFLSNLFCFWPVLLTVSGYRALHMIHHRENATSADPELMHKQARAPQWDLPLKPLKVALYALKDCFGFALPDFLIIVTFSKPTARLQLVPVVLLQLAMVAFCVHLHFWQVPFLWYAALMTTFMMFFRFRLWLEHQGEEVTNRIELSWLEGAILAPHKIWLDWEHHEFPAVPYYNLMRLRQVLGGALPIGLGELLRSQMTAACRSSGTPLIHNA